jgi:hypothetical protein
MATTLALPLTPDNVMDFHIMPGTLGYYARRWLKAARGSSALKGA